MKLYKKQKSSRLTEPVHTLKSNTFPRIDHGSHSMSFLALKKRLKYSTCQVARPRRQHMPNMLKNRTLLFVDSARN